MENYPNLIPPFSIDLETSSQCQYDNVKIYDGASRQRSKVLGTFCRYVCLKKRTRSCLILATLQNVQVKKQLVTNRILSLLTSLFVAKGLSLWYLLEIQWLLYFELIGLMEDEDFMPDIS